MTEVKNPQNQELTPELTEVEQEQQLSEQRIIRREKLAAKKVRELFTAP